MGPSVQLSHSRVAPGVSTGAVSTESSQQRGAPVFQDSGLLSLITNPIHVPVTLFWPTDHALQALSQEQQDFLFKKDSQEKLKEYLKYHVIRDSKVQPTPPMNSVFSYPQNQL